MNYSPEEALKIRIAHQKQHRSIMEQIEKGIATKKIFQEGSEEMAHLNYKQKEKDLKWLKIAEIISELSRCQKRHVGAVILDIYGRVVSTGYNFHPRGTVKDSECLRKDILTGTQMDIGYCCHAERNAITFANYKDMQEGTLYITHAPCRICARDIIQAGITNLVYYKDDKVLREDGISLLKELVGQFDWFSIRSYFRGEKIDESDLDL